MQVEVRRPAKADAEVKQGGSFGRALLRVIRKRPKSWNAPGFVGLCGLRRTTSRSLADCARRAQVQDEEADTGSGRCSGGTFFKHGGKAFNRGLIAAEGGAGGDTLDHGPGSCEHFLRDADALGA